MDGILYCSFSCPLILNVGPIAANLKNDRYYILLASGPSKNNGRDIYLKFCNFFLLSVIIN